jgi:phytoene dehydrogenase-like protein
MAAAITLAQAGQRVLVVEAKATPGGGMRTQEVTLPGFHHDLASCRWQN